MQALSSLTAAPNPNTFLSSTFRAKALRSTNVLNIPYKNAISHENFGIN